MTDDIVNPTQHPQASDAVIEPVRRAKLTFGQPALDAVFGGGIPRDSLTVLTGPPGAGKTILALQLTFAVGKEGQRVIYFTNVSEPHAKLVEHLRSLSFFDDAYLNESIRIYNIPTQARNRGFRETLDFIVATVRSERATMVVIDSFRGLKHNFGTSNQDRLAIFDMSAQLAILGCTCMLVGEYTPDEVMTAPEFAIADTIVELSYSTHHMQLRRVLQIVKMRGIRFLTGEHSYDITSQGISLYLRQETLGLPPLEPPEGRRISLGEPTLDELTRGGLITSSSTLVIGPSGTGKTTLGLYFLAAGAEAGEQTLMVSFQETPAQIASRANHLGLADRLAFGGRTNAVFVPPTELNPDMVAGRIREMVRQGGVTRLVIDSVTELESAIREPERFNMFLSALIGFLRHSNVTTLMTHELPQLFSSDLQIGNRGMSYVVDNIILLRYAEIDASIRRLLTIIKTRGTDHARTFHELVVQDNQLTISPALRNIAQLITGLPRVVDTTSTAREE